MIRAEQPGDAAAIASVTTAAFETALHSGGNEAAIVEVLRAAGALSVSLVAEEGGAIIGHVALSPVRIDGAELGWFGLGPVSVRPDRQRLGIGAALVREALAQLSARGANGCVVLGDPAYYRRFGFEADPALYYEGVPPGYFMRLVLAGTAPSGRVDYHPGFGA